MVSALTAPLDAAARRFAPIIEAASRRHGVDAALVHAIVFVESSYDPEAVSSQGALGLMQLMPVTCERYGVRDPFDPAQNVDAGVRFLKDLLELFESDVELTIAAYNSGASAVIRAGYRIPSNPETLAFVPRVAGYYRSYRLAAEAAEGQRAPDVVLVAERSDAIRPSGIDLGSSSPLDRGLPAPEREKRLVGIVSARRPRQWHLARVRGSGAAASLFGAEAAMRERSNDARKTKAPRAARVRRDGSGTARATAVKGRRKQST